MNLIRKLLEEKERELCDNARSQDEIRNRLFSVQTGRCILCGRKPKKRDDDDGRFWPFGDGGGMP